MNRDRSLVARAAIRQPFDVVARDQVDVGLAARKQAGQFLRVAGAVVEAAEDDVLVRHLPAGLLEELVGRVQDGRDAGLVVGRHDSRAQCVVRARAARRPGDTACPGRRGGESCAGRPTVEIVMCRAPMPRPFFSPATVERLEQIVEIRQRFAHAHHDDVGQPVRFRTAGGSAAAPAVRRSRRPSGSARRR